MQNCWMSSSCSGNWQTGSESSRSSPVFLTATTRGKYVSWRICFGDSGMLGLLAEGRVAFHRRPRNDRTSCRAARSQNVPVPRRKSFPETHRCLTFRLRGDSNHRLGVYQAEGADFQFSGRLSRSFSHRFSPDHRGISLCKCRVHTYSGAPRAYPDRATHLVPKD